MERPWLLTVVYGSPHFSPRQCLWSDLQDIALGVNNAWVVIGDFNTTVATIDRRGPTLLNPPTMTGDWVK